VAGAIGPGDFVECIAGHASRIGRVFRVLDIGPPNFCFVCGGCQGLELSEQRRASTGGWWCPTGYKPIYRPRADLIESLMQPAPSMPEVEPA
jgi:hypothetical protein